MRSGFTWLPKIMCLARLPGHLSADRQKPGNDTSHKGIGIDAQMREGAEQGSKTLCLLCRVATCI